MSTVSPIRKRVNTLSPHMPVDGARAAIEFYTRAFDAEQEWCHTMPGSDLIMNAYLRIGDSHLMVKDTFPGGPPPPPEGGCPVTLNLYVENAAAVRERAIAAGATIVYPIEDGFRGDRYGLVIAPCGHPWAIPTPLEDVSEDELAKRAGAMFSPDGE